MTILDIDTHNRHKLSIYLCKHLKNKRYTKGKYGKILEFTYQEAREAILNALKKAICKKDAKLFLAQLKEISKNH